MRHIYANRTIARVALADVCSDFGIPIVDGRWADMAMARGQIGPLAVDTIPGNITTTEVIGTPGSRSSAVDTILDFDFFRVTLTQGATYAFALTGAGLSNPILGLYDSAGVLIALDDDSGPGFNAFIATFAPTVSGDFYLGASGVATSTGAYTLETFVLSTPDVDGIAGNTSTTSELSIDGASASSVVDAPLDQDWFRITLTAGESYAFSLAANGSALDTFLRLFDASGNLVAVDDDGAPASGTDSLIQFTALQSGIYYLSAGGFESDIGAYMIGAAHGPPQNPLDTIDLGFIFQHTAINVYFALGGEQLGPAGTALRSFTAAEQQSVMQALQTIADVTDLSFASVNSSLGADFILTLSNLPAGVLGQTWPDAAIGYIEFDPVAPGWTALGLAPGGLGFSTIIHEAGHALGLEHPHLDGQDEQVMQGVISEFDSYGSFLMNQQAFTIMSYNDGWPLGPNGAPTSDNFGQAATPMALDLALLQARYGADATRNLGDTVYALGDVNAAGAKYQTIWDAGGIDTIQYFGAAAVTIDLRTATLLSAIGGGGSVSYVSEVQGGFTIAAGAVIENATGGSGNDTLIGGAAGDRLNGAGGLDQLTGGDGDDILIGGAGGDTLNGGAGSDTADYTTSTSLLLTVNLKRPQFNSGDATGDSFILIENVTGSDSNTTLDDIDGDDNANILSGLRGSDRLNGNGGDDTLIGGDGNDNLDGGSGADTLIGGLGLDSVSYSSAPTGVLLDLLNLAANTGAVAEDTLFSIEGASGSNFGDTLLGDNGSTSFNGSGGNDVLVGRLGDDSLNGDSGNDLIDGGPGSDSLNGGPGVDTASYADASAGVTADLSLPSSNSGDAAGDLYFAVENLSGSQLADTLRGDNQANVLIGNAGDDTIDGGVGADVLIGGAGDDTLVVDNEFDITTELSSEGIDLVQSSITWFLGAELENLSLIGAAAIGGSGNELANVLLGNGAVNQLFGNGGADSLDGGLGADAMFGGAGNDAYVVDNTGDVTFEGSALDGTDTVFSSVTRTLGANLENLTLTGAAAIIGNGNALANTIIGNNAANTLFGNGGDDALNGAGGNDILHGNAGADTVDGGTGADTMYGEAGDDTYVVDSGGDITFEGSALDGVDIVLSSVTRALGPNLENLTLTGAAAINGGGNGLANIMVGNNAVNALFGNGGNDTLDGGQGGDKMYGVAGDDTYVVDNAGDVTFEGSALDGTDLVLASVTRSLGANLENLTLTGIAAINGVGNALGNIINGNAGANQLFGNLGDDVLAGGAGNDLLAGGAGNDAFVFAPGSGSDTVTTFLAGGVDDTLDFSAYSGTGITWTITQVGANTVFDFTNGDQITLSNVIAANLVQTDPFGFG